MRALPALMLFMVFSFTALAEVKLIDGDWAVEGHFDKNPDNVDARVALSGAACSAGACLVVNDEKKYAQFFTIDGTTIVAGAVISLLPDEIEGVEMKEIDAEGAAYAAPTGPGANGRFYVTGSHGRSRTGKLRDSTFFVFRLPVDATTGLPTFAFNDDDPAPEVARTPLLRPTLQAQPDLSGLAEELLDLNGVSIEGLAVDGADLLFGFRSPCLGSEAMLLRVNADALFGDQPPDATMHKVALGANAGIRDMAAVEGGFLILGGRSDDIRAPTAGQCDRNDEEKTMPVASLWFWDGTGAAQPLGTIPDVTADDKLETMLVLGGEDDVWRVLILFEGVENGSPREYEARR
jgi:hypothetical protein